MAKDKNIFTDNFGMPVDDDQNSISADDSGPVLNNYHRDGAMRFDNNGGDSPNYYPNSFGGPEPDPQIGEPPFDVTGRSTRQKYTHPMTTSYKPVFVPQGNDGHGQRALNW